MGRDGDRVATLRRQGGQRGGGEAARRGESGGSAAAVAQRIWRDVVPMARKALKGRTNGLLGWAVAAAGRRAVADAWPVLTRGQDSLFSTAFPLFSSSPA